MEFYSAIKKKEILSFADKWMELANIILGEVNQGQKDKGHMFSLLCARQTKIKIQALSYIHINVYRNMFSKVEY
jgi:hypothetical protein